MSNLNGKILGERYRLLEKIGEGGMAVVYKAQDTGLGRFVAVKVIRRGAFPPKQIEHILKRFEREARAQAKLSHPNILTIFDYGEFENQPYLVMEYVPHGSLKDLLKGRPISWNRAAPIIASVARALAAAHAQGIIHRDVKPSNILMANGRDPMLADFGIAKLVESDADTSDLTGTGMGIGTPEYMAPEQASGKSIDHRADIYALGIVLYQMVTGRLPFKGDTPLAIMLLKNTQKVPNPRQYSPDLPRAAENILIKALARNPEERFKDMQEFAAALEGRNMVTETVTLDEYPPPGNAKARKGKNQIRPEWIAVGGVLVLCLSMFLGGAFAVGRAISPTEPPTLTSTPSATSSPTNTPGPTPTPTPLPEEFTDDKGAVMRLIPAGEFTMGSNGGDANERPAHQIYLQDYYMDKYEVANALYETCVKAGVCKPPKQARSFDRENYYGNSEYANYPVIFVDWDQAKTYCEWRGARLPTEAEWEKAARGTDTRVYPWGNNFWCGNGNFDDETKLDVHTVPGGPNCDRYNDTAPVGAFESGKSPYGIFDMAGNVWEWVADWYDENYYATSTYTDPQGAASGQNRVMRGGAWDVYNVSNLRVTRRAAIGPSTANNSIGFRCAKSIP